jgi:hypothetical protein
MEYGVDIFCCLPLCRKCKHFILVANGTWQDGRANAFKNGAIDFCNLG